MKNVLWITSALLFFVAGYLLFGHYFSGNIDINKEAGIYGNKEGESGNIKLGGSSWSWQYTRLHTGEQIDAPADDQFVLSFEDDDRLKSKTDCNQLSGVYVQDGEVLSMGQFVSTKMFCPDSKEITYVEHLGLVNSFSLLDDVLTMNLNRDFGTMIFKRY